MSLPSIPPSFTAGLISSGLKFYARCKQIPSGQSALLAFGSMGSILSVEFHSNELRTIKSPLFKTGMVCSAALSGVPIAPLLIVHKVHQVYSSIAKPQPGAPSPHHS